MRKTHVADGTLQTLYPKPWRPGVALLKQATPDSVEYDGYRNAVIKGSELVLETGGKLLGKSSNSFSLLPLRWTGSTSRMYTPYRQTWPAHARRGQTLFFLSGQQKSYSSRLRRNSGGRGTQIETFVEDARALANATRCPGDGCGHRGKELSPCASGCRICESVFEIGRASCRERVWSVV